MSKDATFPEKFNKIIKQYPEFRDTADAASKDELKAMIVSCEKNIFAIEKQKDEDVELQQAKEKVKYFSEPYSDAHKVQNAKIKYLLFRLESQGEDMERTDESSED